jgi:hypothetical protein
MPLNSFHVLEGDDGAIAERDGAVRILAQYD